MHRTADIQKRPHQFLPANFELTQWESLEPYFKALLDREITNKLTLESWMQDLSELEAFISEDACWRQIKMTCDTTDKSLEAAFTFFCTGIVFFSTGLGCCSTSTSTITGISTVPLPK